jgi:hypothetical protein
MGKDKFDLDAFAADHSVIQSHVFTTKKFTSGFEIERDLLYALDFKTSVWDKKQEIVRMIVEAHIHAIEINDFSMRAPRDWWNAVKERWFPKWLLRKYPVQYTTQEVVISVLYPKLRLPPGEKYLMVNVKQDGKSLKDFE